MKFYSEPNMLVRPSRKTGPFRNIKPFRFDSNGEYTTDNPHIIKMMSRRFKSEIDVLAKREVVEENDDLTDDEIKDMAKAKKIKSWHLKSIETLREELGV